MTLCGQQLFSVVRLTAIQRAKRQVQMLIEKRYSSHGVIVRRIKSVRPKIITFNQYLQWKYDYLEHQIQI